MEKTLLLFVLSWRSLWRNTRRTTLVLLAVSLGVWSMLSFTALLQAWNASSLAASLKNMTGQGQLHARGYLDNPNIEYQIAPPSGALLDVLNGNDVRQWAPRVRVPAAIQSAYDTWPVTMYGIDPKREKGLSFIDSAVHEGHRLHAGNSPGVIIGQKLARRLHSGIGKRIVLMSQGKSGELAERGFKVIGLFSASPSVEDRDVFIGVGIAQKMLGIGDNITGITFDLQDMGKLPSFIQKIKNTSPNYVVRSWEELQPMTKAMSKLMNGFIQVWIVIVLMLMVFGIVNTLLMSMHERLREISLLQALGLRPWLVFSQVSLESAILVLVGVLAGILFYMLTILSFRNGLDLGFLARGAEWLGAGRILYPVFHVYQSIEIGIFVWLIGLMTGLWPTWRIVRRVPIDAINRSLT